VAGYSQETVPPVSAAEAAPAAQGAPDEADVPAVALERPADHARVRCR